MKAFTVWITGLSGSGKTTLARFLTEEMERRGVKAIVVDGEEMRRSLSDGLGYSPEERKLQAKRLAYVSGLLARNGIVAVTASVSPLREARQATRKELGDFVEVYLTCSARDRAQREEKGLYEKFEKGEIKHLAGADLAYEEPESPEVVCDTSALDPEESVQKVVKKLEMMGLLSVPEVDDGYSEDEEKKVEDRLRSLGYIE